MPKTGTKSMISSSVEITNPKFKNIINSLSCVLDYKITSIKDISGGRNSRVYDVCYGTSGKCIVKIYPQNADTEQSRLSNEYSALQFMRKAGIKCVPEPVAKNNEFNYLAYQYIEGVRIDSSTVSIDEINQCVQFLLDLKDLSRISMTNRDSLPLAAEACFSIQSIVDSISLRLLKLQNLTPVNSLHIELHTWLNNSFTNTFEKVLDWCLLELDKLNLNNNSNLDPKYQTLSPSDFGFHNALRTNQGKLIFLDFEYFGWDDPSKMISDFLLHPAMSLTKASKDEFWRNMIGGFKSHPNLESLTKIVYPLWGLKWCSIILNEFHPEIMEIRKFAMGELVDTDFVQTQQLDKAKRLLKKIDVNFREFPYE